MASQRAIYVNLCKYPALLSADPTGLSTGVSIEQAHGDTIIYRIYFREGDVLIDPPSGFTYSLVAKRQNDWNGDVIISQTTDGGLLTKEDAAGDSYLELTLSPTEPLAKLFAQTAGCPAQVRTKVRLDAEVSWSNGGAIRRTRIFPILYTHGVIASGEVFAELDPPSTGISQVTVAEGCELLSGAGTVGDPLQAYHDYAVVEVDVPSGANTFDLSSADYSALGFTPDNYQPIALVPVSLAADFAVMVAGVSGTFVRFSAPIPDAGWKLRVLARRPSA